MKTPGLDRFVARCGWLAVGTVMAYWLLYVCVAPVTTTDGHLYNIARLLLAEQGGLFGNDRWTNYHQSIFPWSFDAVHYPFARLGFLVALPSLLCLVGILALVWLLCLRAGAAASAPFAMLFVLASPTVVLQATTCKNDLATAFFAVAALFFAWRWREEGGRIRWAAASAISLGMCAGAKTTGVAVAGLVFVLAAWSGRGLGWRPWAGFAALAALAMVILGSLETYVNNWLGDGAWMGKPFVIEAHGNPDGLRGALASLVRYGFNSLGTGLETAASGPWLESVLTAASDGVTTALGLGTAGLSDPAQGTRFSLRCYELSSTYGLVGWIALPIAGFVLWRQRLNTAPGQLAALGFAVLLVLCVVMGWRKHNLRLLLPAALPILLSAAVVLAAFVRGRPRVRLGGTIALWALAFAVPLLARTRSPAAIRQAFTNREALSFQEQPPLLVERDAARLIAREVGANGCAVILNRGCWSLPFLLDSRQPWVVVPNRDRAPEIDMATLRHYLPPGASGRWLLLASQCHLGGEVLPPGEPRLLGKFPTGGKLYLLELSP